MVHKEAESETGTLEGQILFCFRPENSPGLKILPITHLRLTSEEKLEWLGFIFLRANSKGI